MMLLMMLVCMLGFSNNAQESIRPSTISHIYEAANEKSEKSFSYESNLLVESNPSELKPLQRSWGKKKLLTTEEHSNSMIWIGQIDNLTLTLTLALTLALTLTLTAFLVSAGGSGYWDAASQWSSGVVPDIFRYD